MWSFYIKNIKTCEEDIIFGYDLRDAWRRRPNLNPGDWDILMENYED